MSATGVPPILERTGTRLREPVVVSAPPSPNSGTKLRQRRARNAVLYGAAVVVVAHLGFALALETALPQLRDPEYGYRLVRVREQQRLHPNRPLVVVLGTSRTQNAIDPTAMNFPDEPGSPLVFNFGQTGARPVDLVLTLRRLRADGVYPAAVLVELFPPALAAPEPRTDPARWTISDVCALDPYCTDAGALRVRWAASRANSWRAHRRVLIDHLDPEWQPRPQRVAPQWKETDALGFRAYRLQTVSEDLRADLLAVTRAAHGPNLCAERVHESADRALRDLVAACRTSGTLVAFYFAPESPQFRSWYAPHFRAALAAYARDLSEGAGCPVFAAPEDFGEVDFADGHHMLRPAAAEFSRRFADTHLKPWLALGR